VQHWKEGGHDQLCKKIKKAGGHEQYHADKKYKEAVAEAVEKCADDTKGQTCFICTQALHWKTKEGLVRGCACRGTAGFAHVSCLAEQAKILYDEGEENNLGPKVLTERLKRWSTCSLCEQKYHGVVACALGWACWKMYVGRQETDEARRNAMGMLANGLSAASYNECALEVYEANLATLGRLGLLASQHAAITKTNMCTVYSKLGRDEEALALEQTIYSDTLASRGNIHDARTLILALNLSASMLNVAASKLEVNRYREAQSFMSDIIPISRRVLGPEGDTTLKLRGLHAKALFEAAGSRADVCQAVTELEEIGRTARRRYGVSHPQTGLIQRTLDRAKAKLALLDAGA
jgi:hypothetical protein